MKVIGVIPARQGSTRLKEKVLIHLLKKPLVQHVWERAKQAKNIDEIVIATDSEKVKNVCEGFGARVAMTSKDCPSGSDRIAEAVKDIAAAIIVNIQGDEPLIHPQAIDDLVLTLIKESHAPVATVIKRIENAKDLENPSIVKVVINKDHYAMYFSRSCIPFNRDGTPFKNLCYYKHLGIYAYRKSFLIGFNKLVASKLEATEKLEQLRILEAGYAIKTVETDKDSIGVDTAEDLKKGEDHFTKRIAMNQIVKLGKISIGGRQPFVLIAGPCVIEGRTFALRLAKTLKDIAKEVGVPLIFKASYDKANRTSLNSFRGPGLKKGLAILHDIKENVGLPILSDIHKISEIEEAAQVLDILQVPAFLCRQTDLVVAVAQTQKIINVKKGQFLAPWDIGQIVKKIESTGNKKILLTERGVSFGYNSLVSDFRAIEIMAKTGYPVVYDATHSVQQPGGLGESSGGNSEFVPLLARCAVAAGVSALFLEVHPHPKQALSDGPNSFPLDKLKGLLTELKAIDRIVKKKL